MGEKMRSLLFVLYALWGTAYSLSVSTPTTVLRAARGSTATLPCLYETEATKRYGFIQWNMPLLEEPDLVVIWSFSSSQYNFGERYINRVNLTGDYMRNDASISISQLTMEDNGTYQCSVTLENDLSGKLQSRMELIVLVPPSIPDCSIEGETVYGNDIQLKCRSKEGSPVPTYSWKSFNIQNQERPLSPPATGTTLLLKNISSDTSGFYICTSANEIGAKSCNITVAVRPPSMNIALYAGIAGGTIAALVIIGVIVYCCCCRDTEDKDSERPNRDDYEEPSRQMRRNSSEQDRNRYRRSSEEDQMTEAV